MNLFGRGRKDTSTTGSRNAQSSVSARAGGHHMPSRSGAVGGAVSSSTSGGASTSSGGGLQLPIPGLSGSTGGGSAGSSFGSMLMIGGGGSSSSSAGGSASSSSAGSQTAHGRGGQTGAGHGHHQPGPGGGAGAGSGSLLPGAPGGPGAGGPPANSTDPNSNANLLDKDLHQTKEQMLGAMLDRARYFATSQLAVQRVVFGKEITSLCYQILSCDTAYQHLIQPYVSKLAWDPEADVRKQILLQFGDLAGFLIQSDPEVGYAYVLATLVPVFPTLLLDPVYKETRQDAAEALLVLSSHLRLQERTDYALRTVLSLSNDSDEEARAMSAFLLNGLAPTLTKELCLEFCAIQLIALGEDQKASVRKAVLLNMKEVASCAGERFCSGRLFETFERLCDDSNYTVRKCGSEQLPLLIETSRKIAECVRIMTGPAAGPVIRIAKKLYNDQNRWVHLALCQNIGYILYALQRFGGKQAVDDELIEYYFQTLKSVERADDASVSSRSVHNEVRYHLGFTFSAVLEAILPLKPERYLDFQNFFAVLCESRELRTRQAIACSLWKIGQTFRSVPALAVAAGDGLGGGGAAVDKEAGGAASPEKVVGGAGASVDDAKNAAADDMANENSESGRGALSPSAVCGNQAPEKDTAVENDVSLSSEETRRASAAEAADVDSDTINGAPPSAEPDEKPVPVPNTDPPSNSASSSSSATASSAENMQDSEEMKSTAPSAAAGATSSSSTPSLSTCTSAIPVATPSAASRLRVPPSIPPPQLSLEDKLIQQFVAFTNDRDDIKLGLAKNVGNFELNPKYLQSLSQMMSSSTNWRLRHSIATVSLPALCEKYEHDTNNAVFFYLLPTYLKLLHDGVAIVRSKAAACTNLVLKAVCVEARRNQNGSGGTMLTDAINQNASKSSSSSVDVVVGGAGVEPHGMQSFDPPPRSPEAISKSTSSSSAASITPAGKTSVLGGGSNTSSPSSAAHPAYYNGRARNAHFSLRTKRIVNHLRRTFKDGNFQHRITYLKMVDSLIRDNSVSRRFLSFFLTSLSDLAHDKVRHVRLQWALLVGPHLKPHIGKCSNHRKLLNAGRQLQQRTNDKEIARALNFVMNVPGSTSRSPSSQMNSGSASETGSAKDADSSSNVFEDEFSDTDSLHFSSLMNSPAGSISSTGGASSIGGATPGLSSGVVVGPSAVASAGIVTTGTSPSSSSTSKAALFSAAAGAFPSSSAGTSPSSRPDVHSTLASISSEIQNEFGLDEKPPPPSTTHPEDQAAQSAQPLPPSEPPDAGEFSRAATGPTTTITTPIPPPASSGGTQQLTAPVSRDSSQIIEDATASAELGRDEADSLLLVDEQEESRVIDEVFERSLAEAVTDIKTPLHHHAPPTSAQQHVGRELAASGGGGDDEDDDTLLSLFESGGRAVPSLTTLEAEFSEQKLHESVLRGAEAVLGRAASSSSEDDEALVVPDLIKKTSASPTSSRAAIVPAPTPAPRQPFHIAAPGGTAGHQDGKNGAASGKIQPGLTNNLTSPQISSTSPTSSAGKPVVSKQPYHIDMEQNEAWPENVAVPLHERVEFRDNLTVPDQPLPKTEYEMAKADESAKNKRRSPLDED